MPTDRTNQNKQSPGLRRKVGKTGKTINPSAGRISGTNQHVEINFEVAKNEVDSAGNVIRVIKPYNVNAIINRVKIEYQQRVSKSMSHANLTELTNIIRVSKGFIGAHYDRLEEWAADNANIVGTALGLPKSDWPSVEGWFKCSGNCGTWGVGSCSGVCATAFCELVPPVEDHGTGQTIIPGSKTYGVRVTF